jgi:hypothetical protein
MPSSKSSASARLAPENAHFRLRKVLARTLSLKRRSPFQRRALWIWHQIRMASNKISLAVAVVYVDLAKTGCPIASRSGKGNDLHHRGEPVLDSQNLASQTSWFARRFPFLFVAAASAFGTAPLSTRSLPLFAARKLTNSHVVWTPGHSLSRPCRVSSSMASNRSVL